LRYCRGYMEVLLTRIGYAMGTLVLSITCRALIVIGVVV
jgi:hypothetical protein